MAERVIQKSDAFTQTSEGKFICKVCNKGLSSKYRMLHHLNLLHNFSPVKPVKKLYNYNKSIKVPKRTLMRRRGLSIESSDETTNNVLELPTKVSQDEMCTGKGNSSTIHVDSKFIEKETGTNIEEQVFPISDSVCIDNLVDEESQQTIDTVPTCDSSDSDFDFSDSAETDSDSTVSESDSTDTDSDVSCLSDNKTSDFDSKSNKENEMCSFGLASYILRYNCSKASSESLLSLVKALNPNAETMKELTYKKIFEDIGQSKYKVIHYCQVCLNSFPEDLDIYQCSTESCEGLRYIGDQLGDKRKPCAFFIVCDLSWQLKLLLERDGILQELLNNKMKAEKISAEMSDIYQGSAYQNLCKDGNFLSYLYNLSGILNTDGIPLYNSSKVKLWPVYISINELSISHRFSRGNTLLAGIWQGTTNPPFLQYFISVADELKSLYENGVEVLTDDCVRVVKFCVCLATMDLQAKAYVTGMTMHNGAFGCITCEEPGETVKQGKGHCRCYPYRLPEQKPEIRDSDDIKFVKGPAATSAKRIKGILGPSGFIAMQWFDMINGMTPDYMHCVLMGVTKHLLYLWVSPTQSGKPYFVGKSLRVISQRLKKITPPSFIQRLPRDLEKHYTNLKATELQTWWLLFYAYPCLEGILPDKYLKHFCELSEAIYILLGDSITSNELDRAEELLDNFYKTYVDLYSAGGSGLNVHNTGAHLVYYVRQWGMAYHLGQKSTSPTR